MAKIVVGLPCSLSEFAPFVRQDGLLYNALQCMLVQTQGRYDANTNTGHDLSILVPLHKITSCDLV